MFSTTTAIIVVTGGALAYYVFVHVVPGLFRRQRKLRREERERSISMAKKI